jgi:hypothetical protein
MLDPSSEGTESPFSTASQRKEHFMRGFRYCAAALALVALLVALPSVATAGRLGFQGMFGFGGDLELESNAGRGKQDARATFGLGAFYEFEFWSYFHFGLNAHFLWFNGADLDRAEIGRSMFIDIAPFLKPRYPLFGGSGEVYLKVPIGLAIVVPSSDLKDASTGTGVAAGALLGFGYQLFGTVGLHAEMGWTGHYTTVDVGNGKVDANLSQFALNFGASLSF